MSKETRQWLSENTLIGFTDKRGAAWHYREGDDNHYSGAVPVADVRSRLFSWQAVERPLFVPDDNGRIDSEEGYISTVPGRKAVVRSDNGHVMGIFADGYQPHQYDEWLVTNVASILDSDLAIGSAGLLKGGAVAWVSVEVPENIVTPEGVEFRPGLMARTSFDGSLSTTYGRHITNVVCDNTMGVAATEHGGQVMKVKHSRKSLGRLTDARDALGIVHDAADSFTAEVARLCETSVSERTWDKIMDALVPMPEREGKRTRAITMAEGKREALSQLWSSDPRVAPWHGTAFGVWQAFNTYGQHSAIVRGTSRQERNMMNAVSGKTQDSDVDTMSKVLALV